MIELIEKQQSLLFRT